MVTLVRLTWHSVVVIKERGFNQLERYDLKIADLISIKHLNRMSGFVK